MVACGSGVFQAFELHTLICWSLRVCRVDRLPQLASKCIIANNSSSASSCPKASMEVVLSRTAPLACSLLAFEGP